MGLLKWAWIRCNKRISSGKKGECRVDFPSLIVAEHGHNQVQPIYRYLIESNYILDFIIATYGDVHSIRLMLYWLNSLRSNAWFMPKHFVKCFFFPIVSPSLSKLPLPRELTLWHCGRFNSFNAPDSDMKGWLSSKKTNFCNKRGTLKLKVISKEMKVNPSFQNSIKRILC